MKTILIAIGVCLIFAANAIAQTCSYSITPLNFGTVNLLSGAAVDARATLSVSCTNNLTVSLAARICTNFGAGSGSTSGSVRTMTGASALQYQLYKDSAHTVPWGHSSATSMGTANPLDILLLPLTTVTSSQQIYGRILANQQSTRGGAYISTFSAASDIRLNVTSYTLGAPDCSTVTQNAASPTFTVQANVDRTCTVAADTMSFGSKGLLKTQVDSSTVVRVSCTVGLPFKVGLGSAADLMTPTTRKMRRAGQAITYGLYQNNARTVGWGHLEAEMLSGNGTGTNVNFTVYGRVPVQPTPAPGVYSDTVVVTVIY